MKPKMRNSIAIALTVLLSVMTFIPMAQGQPPQRFKADSGVVTLGPNQIMRITITWGDGHAGIVRFGRTTYTPDGCNSDGVCKLSGTNTFTGPITLMPGEAASFDILAGGTYGRGVVVSSSQNAQVTVSIIDVATGRVEAVVIGLLIP